MRMISQQLLLLPKKESKQLIIKPPFFGILCVRRGSVNAAVKVYIKKVCKNKEIIEKRYRQEDEILVQYLGMKIK